MTKDEAILEMMKGKKVRHRFFTDNEWMMILDKVKNIYLFEDGVEISAQMFWMDRRDGMWNTDWEIYNDQQVQEQKKQNMKGLYKLVRIWIEVSKVKKRSYVR